MEDYALPSRMTTDRSDPVYVKDDVKIILPAQRQVHVRLKGPIFGASGGNKDLRIKHYASGKLLQNDYKMFKQVNGTMAGLACRNIA